MKKIITIFSLVAFLSGTQSISAQVWRVSNGPLDTDPDYTSLATAISNASDGDTIYVAGSPNSYGSVVLSKKLIIIGPGYWLDVNDTTQAYQEPATITTVTFNAGSEGSVLEGMRIDGSATNLVTINADNITLCKNYVRNTYDNFTARTVYIYSGLTGVTVKQNWLQKDSRGYVINFGGSSTGCKIYNNFLKITSMTYYALQDYNSSSNDIEVTNNVIWGKVATYYTHHTNNIMVDGSYYDNTGNVTHNNLCNGSQYPAGNGNQQNVDMSTVFEDYTGTVDSAFALKSGSPAIGAGAAGGDCGVFGYNTTGTPYVLSGVPAIPAIFDAEVQSLGSSSIPVTIKAISHNTGK